MSAVGQPLTQENLDDMPCQKCGATRCGDIVDLKARCHAWAPVNVTYTRGSGFVAISCAVCGKLVAELALGRAASEVIAPLPV